MQIHSHRFGALEIESREVIKFPDGIIGFPDDHEYVLLRRDSRSVVGWLHSTTNPNLAFPVVSLDALALDSAYFEALTSACFLAGFPGVGDKLAAMAIVCALTGGSPTVNLLAPVVVTIEERTGAQIFLCDSHYTTKEPFRLRDRKGPARVRAPMRAAGAP